MLHRDLCVTKDKAMSTNGMTDDSRHRKATYPAYGLGAATTHVGRDAGKFHC